MQELRQSTEVKVRVGPFVDVTDGFTPETGVTLSGADEAELLKHNGAATVSISAATWAAVTGCDGWYDLTITTSLSDTLGMVTVVVQDDSVCLPVHVHFMVVTANYWDSKYSTEHFDVNVVEVSDDTTAANNLELAFDGTGFGFTNCVMPTVTTLTGNTAQTGDSFARLGAPAGASIAADLVVIDNFVDDLEGRLTAARAGYLDNLNIAENVAGTSEITALNDPTAAAIADAVWNEARADHVGAGSYGETLATVETNIDNLDTAISTVDGKVDTIDGNVDAILLDTAEIGAAGAGLTAIPWNASWDTEVQSECNDALVVLRLDELIAAEYTFTPTAGSVFSDMTESDGGVCRFVANALEQSPTGGTNPNVMVDTTIASVTTPDTVFVLTAGSNVDDAYNGMAIVISDVSNSNYPSVHIISDYVGASKTVTIDTEANFTLVSGDGAKIFVTAPGTVPPTAATVADAVWNEARADHVGAGSYGETLATVETNIDNLDTAISTVDGKVDTIDGIVDAILLDTAEIGAAGAGLTAIPWNASWDAEVQSECNDALVALRLDELISAEYTFSPTAGSVFADMTENDGGLCRFVTNALEQAPTGGTNPNVLVDTTIASVTTPDTVFVLTAGSDIDDAYNDMSIVLYDATNNDYPSVHVVSDYVGASKTVTIDSEANFTLAGSDGVKIFTTAPGTVAPTADTVANAVWDEILSAHTTGGSASEQLLSLKANVDSNL